MSLAVAPEKFSAFEELARRRDVEATAVGTFTNTGYIELMMGEIPVGLLSLDFLHRGLPVMEIPARWKAPERPEPRIRDVDVHSDTPLGPDGKRPENIVVHSNGRGRELGTFNKVLLWMLAEPNVASKESLIRQYDHEVQARTVEKPFTGIMRDAPSDGGVVKVMHTGSEALTVTHGICPRYGDADTKIMARMAVDEAYRAHIALGGAPGRAALLDNFCWPDPVESEATPDGAYKAAQLVRACEGLREACLAYGLPLVSGKDSMKNDARSGDKVVSVRPTLLVTLLGAVEDVRKTPSTDFLNTGDYIYLLGETNGELGGTMLERYAGLCCGAAPDVDFEKASQVYNALHRAIQGRIVQSCHDCSDGGLAVALAESCIGGRLGCSVVVDSLPGAVAKAGDSSNEEANRFERLVRALFCESGGRFIVSVRNEDRERFERTMSGTVCRLIGTVESEPVMRVRGGDKPIIELPVQALVEAFKKTFASER
jgi:phosphoribosylformylglycinamidine synthase